MSADFRSVFSYFSAAPALTRGMTQSQQQQLTPNFLREQGISECLRRIEWKMSHPFPVLWRAYSSPHPRLEFKKKI